MICLPGGLWHDGRIEREYRFKPATGQFELSLAEDERGEDTLPQRVTAALVATLAHIGRMTPTPKLVGRLCVADRQFLMRQLAVALGLDDVWLRSECGACGTPFDLRITNHQMPIKPAGDGYPFATVSTSGGVRRWRVPNGDDQEAIARFDDAACARRVLIRRALVAEHDEPDAHRDDDPGGDALTDDDLDAVEAAIESVSPELAVTAQTRCPTCDHPNDVEVDPYLCLGSAHSSIYLEVHTLASKYHWSEADVLALPTRRRRLYLSLLERSEGKIS